MAIYTEYLKCDFTDAEISDRAKELASANRRRTSIEQQKKEIDSDLKSQIEAENSKIQRLADQISMGYEYRNIDCLVELDTPELGKKRIVRVDTGEEVKVVAMIADDKQASLDLSAPVPEDPAVAIPGGVLEPLPVESAAAKQKVSRKRNPDAEEFADGSGE